MAQLGAHYPHLVYQQHIAGPQPPSLSTTSGTSGSSLSSNPHEMPSSGSDSDSPPPSSAGPSNSRPMYDPAPRLRYSPQPSSFGHTLQFSSYPRYHGESSGVGPDRDLQRRRNARQEQADASISYLRHPHPSSELMTRASRSLSPEPHPPFSQDGHGHALLSYTRPELQLPDSRPASDSPASSLTISTSPSPSTASGPATSSSQDLVPAAGSEVWRLVNPRQTSESDHKGKNKKQRLTPQDRKTICLYAEKYHNLKQDDVAKAFLVERSTVSKILKRKEEWMRIKEDTDYRPIRERVAKFPMIEDHLTEWVMKCTDDGVLISDAMIRRRAQELAQYCNFTPGRFKASQGWLENFKDRVGISKGVWHGNSRNARLRKSMPEDLTRHELPNTVGRLPPIPKPITEEELAAIRAGRPVGLGSNSAAPDAQDSQPEAYPPNRRHPVWQSPEQSGDGDRHRIDVNFSTNQHQPTYGHIGSPAEPYAAEPMPPTPPQVAPVLVSYNGTEALVLPQAPTYRPNVDQYPAKEVVENAIDTLIAFINHEGSDVLDRPEVDAVYDVKRKIFTYYATTNP